MRATLGFAITAILLVALSQLVEAELPANLTPQAYLPQVGRAAVAAPAATLTVIPSATTTTAFTPSPTVGTTNTDTPTPMLTNSPTSTATPTPVPTNSPTSTATPTSTPTTVPVSGTVSVLANDFSYVDGINDLHVLGEVQNNTDTHLRSVRVSAIFLNGTGAAVGSKHGDIPLANLPVGAKSCFEISLAQPAGWASYQFETPTYNPGGQPLPNLVVIGDSGAANGTGGYDVGGQVRNDAGQLVENVNVVGTLYDASSKVIGCGFTGVASTDLSIGQTSTFQLTFMGGDYSGVSNYRLQVDGRPK